MLGSLRETASILECLKIWCGGIDVARRTSLSGITTYNIDNDAGTGLPKALGQRYVFMLLHLSVCNYLCRHLW